MIFFVILEYDLLDMKTIFTFILFFALHFVVYPQDDILYSFFVAGHTYGKPGVNNVGVHPPFKAKFNYIQSRTEIQFGVFTGDIVITGTVQNWDEIDEDVEELGLPVYFAVGNHDMSNRPLYESRYGITYYSFIHENDLIIVLDPNIDNWNISGEQLVFLEDVIDQNNLDVENIFVFFHQILWRENDNIYQDIIPNSFSGRADTINFWSEVEPLFNNLPNEVFMFCGDLGAGSWSSNVMYDAYDNISFIGSGMGDVNGENFIVVNVLNDKTVNYDLICLSDVENCLGELTDYQLTTDTSSDYESFTEFSVFPNPATDHINISISIENDAELIIYNLNGQKVLTQTVPRKTAIKLDISKLSKGLYIGVINNEQTTQNFRFIIQ